MLLPQPLKVLMMQIIMMQQSSLRAAANADVIVLCLGENAYAESPGNTRDLALPDNQIALAKAAASTGKPVILILTEGRPRFITAIEPSYERHFDGILEWKENGRSYC